MDFNDFDMRKSVLLFASLCVSSILSANCPEKVLINNDWTFALGNAGDMMKDFTHGTEYFTYYTKVRSNNDSKAPIMPEFDDLGWQKVSLPHDWVVDLPYDGGASHSHGYKCIGWKYPENSVGWYRKHLNVLAEEEGKQIFIEFEGIFRNSQVFCNGFYLGHQVSGYSSDVYDLTDYLNYGGDNVICVRCDASTEEGWFYEGAGIYRNVYLHTAGPVAIKPYSFFVDKGRVVSCEYVYKDASVDPSKVSAVETILDADGNKVAKADHPWSLDDPYLYTLKLDLYYDGALSASYSQRFGVRDIEFSPEQGFLLNGRRVQLKGADLHLDHAGVGVAVTDEIWRYRLQQLRKYGFNAIRSSHNPASPAMLDLCDEMGFAVIDEQRQFGSNEEQKSQFRNMIERDRNHPCVILWSVGNEEWAAEWNVFGTRIAASLTEYAHSIDPTRPTTYGSSSGPDPNRGVDVFGFNYVIQNNISGLLAELPSHTGVGTEETSGCGTRGKYATDPETGAMLSFNREGVMNAHMAGIGSYVCSSDGAEGTLKMPMTQDGRVLNVIERGWKYYHQHPELGGLFYWTGFDYRGESNPMVWPATGSQFGILDYCGFPKDEAFYLKSVWTDETVLYLSPHWNHPVPEGSPISVWAYTNCDKVTLYVNGKNMGTRKVETDGFASWDDVPYKPGRIEARGVRNGKSVKAVCETTGPATDIVFAKSKDNLERDGQDVVIIDIEARDAKGRFVPDADYPITVSVSGAQFLGWGNGDPGFKHIERPADGSGSLTIRTFSGRAQVIVRSIAGADGPIKVSLNDHCLTF